MRGIACKLGCTRRLVYNVLDVRNLDTSVCNAKTKLFVNIVEQTMTLELV